MTKEKILTKNIQLICGAELGWQCHDVNVGGGLMANGSYFKSGIPSGFPDLLIITNDGRVIFIEAKVGNNKPSEEQKNFIVWLRNNGHFADVVYNVQQFRDLIKNDFKKYFYVTD